MAAGKKRNSKKAVSNNSNNTSKPRKKIEKRAMRNSIPPPTPGIVPTGIRKNTNAAAKYLIIGRNTLLRRCDVGLIVYTVMGNAYEFDIAHLDDYKARCTRNG